MVSRSVAPPYSMSAKWYSNTGWDVRICSYLVIRFDRDRAVFPCRLVAACFRQAHFPLFWFCMVSSQEHLVDDITGRLLRMPQIGRRIRLLTHHSNAASYVHLFVWRAVIPTCWNGGSNIPPYEVLRLPQITSINVFTLPSSTSVVSHIFLRKVLISKDLLYATRRPTYLTFISQAVHDQRCTSLSSEGCGL